MFPQNENRNEGAFACFPGTKTGMRAHSPKPPFSETALLPPSDIPKGQGPCHIKNTTVILIHYGGGKKQYDGNKTLRQGL